MRTPIAPAAGPPRAPLTRRLSLATGKQKFEAVEIDTSSPVELLKAQLFALTGVPPERQKIMGVKGGTLKDDADLSALGLKAGQNLMLMGSAEKAPEAPTTATVFAEDMPEVEQAAMATDNPGGLSNLGNSCYLNSTLQCMKAIPELTKSLELFSSTPPPGMPPPPGGPSIVPQFRSLINTLQGSSAAREVRPLEFVSAFRNAFPTFAERTENGQGFVQQDAEECWSALVTHLSQHMKLTLDETAATNLSTAESAAGLPRQQALKHNLGDMLFGLELESTYKCLEGDGAEPPYTVHESKRTMQCHISEKTAHLYTALEVNLDEVVDKRSEILEREAPYSKKSTLARLPPVLAVQFVRFAWRKDTAKRAKILRTVSFPPVLDVRGLCSRTLQAAIAAHCTALEEERDAAVGGAAAGPAPAAAPAAGSSSSAGDGEASSMDVEPPKSAEELAEAAKGAKGAECGDCATGRYELFAVITHQGRTAEGGHYVAWVKKDPKKWLVFDDETVAEVDADRIKELYGGGDWHMAYMCAAGPRPRTRPLGPPAHIILGCAARRCSAPPLMRRRVVCACALCISTVRRGCAPRLRTSAASRRRLGCVSARQVPLPQDGRPHARRRPQGGQGQARAAHDRDQGLLDGGRRQEVVQLVRRRGARREARRQRGDSAASRGVRRAPAAPSRGRGTNAGWDARRRQAREAVRHAGGRQEGETRRRLGGRSRRGRGSRPHGGRRGE